MKFVRIKKIELINYRQFLEQKIDFKLAENKNIIVIEGKNGFGKSNIYNAINWCFFGTEEHLRPDDRSLPICNTKQFSQIKPNKSLETCVKVTLDTDEGLKEIERKVVTSKNQDGKHYQGESEFKIIEQDGKDWKIAPYPEYIISRILPRTMRHFFFIDGEKLRQLFENIEPEQIKKSIFDLSQITLLQNAVEHLEIFKSSFRKTIKDEPNLTWIEEAMERIKSNIEGQKVEKKKILNDLDVAFINKKKLEDELDKTGNKNVQLLETERKNIEQNILNLENIKKEKKQEYAQYLFKVAPSVATKDALEKTLNIISKLENSSELPPKIQATFLEELLSKGKCICGTDLSSKENYSKKEKLEALLKKARYSNIVNETLELKYLLKNLLREGQDSDKRITEFELKLNELDDQVNENQKKLKEIMTQIGSIDSAKIKAIHEERQKYKESIYELKGRLGRLEQGIKMEEDKFREMEKSYNLVLSKKSKYKVIKEKIEICDQSIKLLEMVKEKIMDEIRGETEKHTKEYFNKLITAKNFEDVKISKNYDLIVEKDGFNAVTSLSAAETLCMGYSFMSALRQTSGFLAPIIIDTPLAKIDIEYRINVADWFKRALTNVQVILLVTDAEYTAGFKKEIGSSICQEFSLKHDEKKGASEVCKYGE
jgi:DNA sulfur modification protein DndD